MSTFEGKVVLITGAARGMGRSHCLHYAGLGADVIALDACAGLATVPYAAASEEDLEATADAVRGLGRNVVARKVDVRDQSAMTTAVSSGVDELGRLDIAVANAAIAPLMIDPTDPEQVWRDVIDVNLTGAYNTAQAAAPSIIAGGVGGNIVFINSTAGLKGSLAMGTVGGYAYTASKHGLVGLTRAFAIDLAPHSIRVNTLHLSGVATPMVVNESMERLTSILPRADGVVVSGWLPDMSRAVSGLAVA
ncbi:SDR family NAD(P)-dependent oxidoreductase [Streptomyces sp. NPDC001982]|uniref:SDR family NAD(P)-dependent oxidoreductase n=1 Tax=Streptomyces sp. NPDC001982 TaxID=3154405 RepID=UPI00332C332B